MAFECWYLFALITVVHGVCEKMPLFGDCYGGVTPINPYIFVGQQLILNCTLKPEYTSDQVYFTCKDDQRIDEFVTVLTPQIAQLNMTMASLTDGTTYQCWLNTTDSENKLVGGQVVQVEYYPQKIQDLNCIVNNWDTMTCTWNLGVEYKQNTTTEVNLIWSTFTQSRFQNCSSSTRTSCYWPEEEYEEQAVKFQLNITVRNTKKNEAVMSSHVIVADEIVKPANIENLHCDGNNTCIRVSWTHPRRGRNLTYHVGLAKIADLENKTVFETRELNHTICSLKPFTKYNITVSAKLNQMGFWSDPVTMIQKTMEDVPVEGPYITSGCYTEELCSDEFRNVTVHIKAPKKEYQNGILKKYTAKYRQISSQQWNEITVDAAETTVPLILMCAKGYEVYLYACTSVGCSENFSKLKIGKEGTVGKPENLQIGLFNATETCGTVMATWDKPADTDIHSNNCTLYWCAGSKQTLKCEEGFDWLKVPCKMTKVILPLCAADVDGKINLFGISMETERGSSGIAWSECIYVERKIPDKMSGVKLADNSPDLSLTVTWANARCANRVLINGYFIDYCQFNTETENCEEPDQSERVEETENSYTIRGLMAGVTYSVKMKSSSTGGNGSQSDPVFGVPVDTSMDTGQTVGIVIGCIFVTVLILAGIIWFLRCCRKGLCKRMKITLPEIPEKYLTNDMENKPGYTNTGEDPASCSLPVSGNKNVKGDAKIFKTQIGNNDSGHGSLRSNSVGETSNKEAGDSPHSPTIADVPDLRQDKDSSDSVKERKNTGFGLREGRPVDYSKFTTAESLSDACIPEPAIKQNNTHVVGFVQGSENPSFNMQGLQSSEDEHTSSDMTGVKVNGTDGFSDYSAEGSDISPCVTAVDQNTQSGLADTDTSDDKTPYIHGRESSDEDLDIPAISNAQTLSLIDISQASSTTEDVKDECTNHAMSAAIRIPVSPDKVNNLLYTPALMSIPNATSNESQFVISSVDKNNYQTDKMPNFHQVESYTHASNVGDRGYVPHPYTENSESDVVSCTRCPLPLSAKEGDTDPSYVTEVDLPLLRLTKEVLPVSASESVSGTEPIPVPTVDSDGSSFARSNNNPTLQVAVASEISEGVNPETDVNTYMPIKMANTGQSTNNSTESKDHGCRMQTHVHPDYI